MIRVGDLELSPDLFWENRFASPLAAMNSRQTMGVGGRTIRDHLQTDIKASIRLVARSEGDGLYGFFTHAQLLGLRELERSGLVQEFEYEGELLQVIVPPGGIDMAMRLERPNPGDDDKYYGALTLEEV